MGKSFANRQTPCRYCANNVSVFVFQRVSAGLATVRERLPIDVIKRRKRGFNIPFSKWLLHGLGDEFKTRFSAERVEARGLFNPSGIATLLDEHLAGLTDHRKPLFTLLALDLWCDATFGEGVKIPVGEITEPEDAPR